MLGSKDDHLFPSLPIRGRGKKRHRGIGGICTSHLQSVRLWETIGKSTNEFPRRRTDKCVHTEGHTVHGKACSGTQFVQIPL